MSVNASVAVSIAIYSYCIYLEWQYIYLSTLRQTQKHCALYVVHVWFIVSAGSAQVYILLWPLWSWMYRMSIEKF